MNENKKNHLQQPSVLTMQRLLEVEFFVLIKLLVLKNENKFQRVEAIIQTICSIIEIDYYVIEYLIVQIRRGILTASPTELTLLLYFRDYLNASSLIKSKIMHRTSYYKNLKKYIRNQEPNIIPVFKDTHHAVIKEFLEKFYQLFRNIKEVL